MLAMHVLQSTLVLLNTLLGQKVLAEPEWADRLTEADLRGLTPLFWSNINPVRHVLSRHDAPARPRAPAALGRVSSSRIAATLRLGTATHPEGQRGCGARSRNHERRAAEHDRRPLSRVGRKRPRTVAVAALRHSAGWGVSRPVWEVGAWT